MRVRYDLDQLALSQLIAREKEIDTQAKASLDASAEIAAQALSDGAGLAGQQLSLQEAWRLDLAQKREENSHLALRQSAVTRVSFAKWRVSSKLAGKKRR